MNTTISKMNVIQEWRNSGETNPNRMTIPELALLLDLADWEVIERLNILMWQEEEELKEKGKSFFVDTFIPEGPLEDYPDWLDESDYYYRNEGFVDEMEVAQAENYWLSSFPSAVFYPEEIADPTVIPF